MRKTANRSSSPARANANRVLDCRRRFLPAISSREKCCRGRFRLPATKRRRPRFPLSSSRGPMTTMRPMFWVARKTRIVRRKIVSPPKVSASVLIGEPASSAQLSRMRPPAGRITSKVSACVSFTIEYSNKPRALGKAQSLKVLTLQLNLLK